MTWDLTTLDDMEELDMTELTETLDSVKPKRNGCPIGGRSDFY